MLSFYISPLMSLWCCKNSLPPLHVDSLSTLLLVWPRIRSLPKPPSLSLIPLHLSSLDQCFSSSQHAHTRTYTHWVSAMAGWASLKSYVCACVSPVVWAIKVSIYWFLCDRLLTLTHRFCLSNTHTHECACVCGHVNYIITKTQNHCDLQHLQPSVCYNLGQSLPTGWCQTEKLLDSFPLQRSTLKHVVSICLSLHWS